MALLQYINSEEFANWDWRIAALMIFLAGLLTTRLITTLRYTSALKQVGKGRYPPTVPYTIPGAGSLPYFGADACGFLTKAFKSYGNTPFAVRIATQKLHFISGAEYVLSMFRQARDLDTSTLTIMVLERAFGSPLSTRHVYERDNTGISTQPLEGSRELEHNNRIFHNNHKIIGQNLVGNGLSELASRFLRNFDSELNTLNISEEWVDVPDFYSIIQKAVFRASTMAVCGPHIFRLNPTFTEDFWDFDHQLPGMFKGLPRWLIPKAYQVRDKMKNSVAKWHAYAKQNFDPDQENLDKIEWEEFYGSKLVRERARNYDAIDGYNVEAHAANDLGLLWGVNANIAPLMGWFLIDILLRPQLLARVLPEINRNIQPASTSPHHLYMPGLLANPLLQSVMAEELRLRMGFLVTRVSRVDNFQIGDWRFPKGKLVIASTWHAHRDNNIWNDKAQDGEPHPVEEFWAERFLAYPDDRTSGPRKPGSANENDVKKTIGKPSDKSDTGAGGPVFTSEPVTGSYFPYGGGAKICPGRFYSKHQAIGGVSLFLKMFEVEFVREKNEGFPVVDMGYYPFAILPPKGKLKARIRRRTGN